MSNRTTTREGYVYFATDGENVKIGFARDPRSRVASLQTASSKTLTLMAWAPGTMGDESGLHKDLETYRVRGEWFEPSPEVMQIVRGAQALYRYFPSWWSSAPPTDTSGADLLERLGDNAAPAQLLARTASVPITELAATLVFNSDGFAPDGPEVRYGLSIALRDKTASPAFIMACARNGVEWGVVPA